MAAEERIILISNDDGIDSPGIRAIAEELRTIAKVYVVAPDRQRSAVSSALTIEQALRALPTKFIDGVEAFAVNGTPADCVKLAICELLPRKPDMVVSGINLGQNTSINMLYSGTVAAATEGVIFGIPSMAISLADFRADADCLPAAKYGKIIAERMFRGGLPKGVLLNVNVPKLTMEEIKGIKITDYSNSKWIDRYDKRVDPFGREYYWFAGGYEINDTRDNADDVAIANGFVSVSPIKTMFTNTTLVSELENLW